eukprot:TRINITY_DN60677_c0_g1_i1.p1 TRINITY_DN60677_c0_g1~~TRINITY_DN60677_c0_g1_i1.p1  ORF type:complete len:162 (-),score=7.83 TRINITY_DN60677_c0_g1_i1:169-654(-)
MVVLGSALGAACVWPALGCGFRAVGFEKLPVCVAASRELAASSHHVLDYMYKSQVQRERPGPLASFYESDVLEDKHRVATELKDADLAWANDFAWGSRAQRALEEVALRELPVGGMLVLYRAPQLRGNSEFEWRLGAKLTVPTSWTPHAEMHILVKIPKST